MTYHEEPDPEAVVDVTRIRELRASLQQLTRELMVWIGLLRHKAMALRSLAGRPPESAAGLMPGSLDPKALADDLAAGLSRLARPSARVPMKYFSMGAEEAIQRARYLWDTVADPSDPVGAERLAEAAEQLAMQLEVRVNQALDQYQALGDDLVRALRGRPDDPRPPRA